MPAREDPESKWDKINFAAQIAGGKKGCSNFICWLTKLESSQSSHCNDPFVFGKQRERKDTTSPQGRSKQLLSENTSPYYVCCDSAVAIKNLDSSRRVTNKQDENEKSLYMEHAVRKSLQPGKTQI